MPTIAELVSFAEENNLPMETPVNVYVAIEDAQETEDHANEMDDGHGAIWSTYPRIDEDGMQLNLHEIQPRKSQNGSDQE